MHIIHTRIDIYITQIHLHVMMLPTRMQYNIAYTHYAIPYVCIHSMYGMYSVYLVSSTKYGAKYYLIVGVPENLLNCTETQMRETHIYILIYNTHIYISIIIA